MELNKKTVVITGGATGLGLSLTKAFLKEGAEVHVLSRNVKEHEKIKSEINNPNLFTHQTDVTDFASVESAIKTIPNVDVLINNAGVWIEGPLQDNSADEISKVIDVNTKGVIFATKATLPKMLGKNEGYILNISSTSGLKGKSNQSVYVASKFGVRGFTESLKEDLMKTNIKVAGFYPGGMSTQFFAKSGVSKENSDWMNTEKVAQVVVFMVKQDDTMILDHVVLNKRGTRFSN